MVMTLTSLPYFRNYNPTHIQLSDHRRGRLNSFYGRPEIDQDGKTLLPPPRITEGA